MWLLTFYQLETSRQAASRRHRPPFVCRRTSWPRSRTCVQTALMHMPSVFFITRARAHRCFFIAFLVDWPRGCLRGLEPVGLDGGGGGLAESAWGPPPPPLCPGLVFMSVFKSTEKGGWGVERGGGQFAISGAGIAVFPCALSLYIRVRGGGTRQHRAAFHFLVYTTPPCQPPTLGAIRNTECTHVLSNDVFPSNVMLFFWGPVIISGLRYRRQDCYSWGVFTNGCICGQSASMACTLLVIFLKGFRWFNSTFHSFVALDWSHLTWKEVLYPVRFF